MKHKKKILRMISNTTNTTGWLALMYFMWINVNDIGMALSLVTILLSDILEVWD